MIKSKGNYLTSTEAAEQLGFSADHIRKLLFHGKMKGEKIGRNWVVHEKELSKVKRQRFRRGKEKEIDGSSNQ